MKRLLPIVFIAAFALYLPAMRYGFVQDDRAIIASNPAAHSVVSALRGFDDPYWPPESGAGLYRPLTILSYAVDWTVSGGSVGWLHIVNAFWHAVACVLFALVLARWLPSVAAAGAALLFAWHPVHVEAVASLVGRAELLAAAGILGSVLAARRGWWAGAVLCAGLAMLSKEHAVIAGVVILIDRWLQGADGREYPAAFWMALAALTGGYLVAWFVIGRSGAGDVAAVFYGRGTLERLAIALPAILRAAVLLFWPVSLSVDYGPQVIPAYDGISAAAILGGVVVVAVAALAWWCRRRAPAISFAAALAALSYLPTANLLFPSGVVLAERNLYLAVALPAAIFGFGLSWLLATRGLRPVVAAIVIVASLGAVRSLVRLPAWRDNRSQLLTLLTEHPESYRAHASAAAVLAGIGDTAGTRREYGAAASLFRGDPYVDAAHAIFLLGIGDTTAAVPLVARPRVGGPADRLGLRAEFLLELARANRARALAVAAAAQRRFPGDQDWYRQYLQ